jgi:hypothetical protein
MMKNHSYFSLPEYFHLSTWLDRKLHPFLHVTNTELSGYPIDVHLTQRATQGLSQLSIPLTVEMQLYFSCVVKKRVLIHSSDTQQTYQPAYENLYIKFTCVQADSCSPEEFASHYPGKKQLTAPANMKMHARALYIDYKDNEWLAHYDI